MPWYRRMVRICPIMCRYAVSIYHLDTIWSYGSTTKNKTSYLLFSRWIQIPLVSLELIYLSTTLNSTTLTWPHTLIFMEKIKSQMMTVTESLVFLAVSTLIAICNLKVDTRVLADQDTVEMVLLAMVIILYYLFQCEIIDYNSFLLQAEGCSRPLDIENGRILSTEGNYRMNAVITYLCYPQYTMVGGAQRTCQANGEWSGNEPQCVGDSDSKKSFFYK